jgi:uncharacterized protein YndB with AHSA1/START domain/DNA-binding transcriptional ArsR family regulator
VADAESKLVFRALADPHRRVLLDRLFVRDGQALGELEAALPQMTRFGVMKHLRLLEAAGLVTTRRHGRRKLHFLNPVPIQLIADRWISKYAATWVRPMTRLKHTLEEIPMPKATPKHVYEVYIQAPPERVWQAITDPVFTRQYYYDNEVASDWQPGAKLVYRDVNDGSEAIIGEIVEADPPRRLVHTFHFPGTDESPSRVTWTIEPRGEASLLILVHDDFDGETTTYRSVEHGWVPILSGLKTLLETGKPLQIEYPGVPGVRS